VSFLIDHYHHHHHHHHHHHSPSNINADPRPTPRGDADREDMGDPQRDLSMVCDAIRKVVVVT